MIKREMEDPSSVKGDHKLVCTSFIFLTLAFVHSMYVYAVYIIHACVQVYSASTQVKNVSIIY